LACRCTSHTTQHTGHVLDVSNTINDLQDSTPGTSYSLCILSDRGFHVITAEVTNHLPELSKIPTGLLHLFIKHTSASLTVNESADPDVRMDMETFFNENVPENAGFCLHTMEGRDDMTSHIKTSILGSSLTVSPLHHSLPHIPAPVPDDCINPADLCTKMRKKRARLFLRTNHQR